MKKLLLIFLLGWLAQMTGQTCPPVPVPFLESFSTGTLPACWINQNPTSTSTSANVKWKFSGAPGYGTTNNGKPAGTYAWVDASTPYDNIHTVELISRQIDLTGLTAPYVQFEWFKNHLTSATGTLPNNDNNELKLHINDGSGWVQLWASTSNLDEWRTVGIALPASYIGATVTLRFTVDKNTGTNPYFYDDILLDQVQVMQAPTCFVPTVLPVSNVTPAGATISWTPPATAPAQGYEYYYSPVNTAPTATTVGTSTMATTANIGPLVAGTTYYWWVRSVCSASDKTAWVPGNPFTPGQIGTGTATTSNLPVYSCFGYGYSQQIYTGAEVTSAVGTNQVITKIRFKVDSPVTPQTDYNEWTVFMGNTTQANFATTTSWVPYNQLQQVWSGTVPNMVAGTWVELTLNVPFIWDGVSNIVIGVDENADDWACTAQWGGYTAGTNRGILYYSDGTNPDPASPPTASSRYSVIPQLQLVGEPLPPCTAAAPTNLNVTGITNVGANLSWMPAQGATYVVQWRPVTTPAAPWTTITPAPTFSFYQLTGLQEQTLYEFRVAYVCGTVQGTFATPVQFTTLPMPYCTSSPTSTTVRGFISKVGVYPNGAAQMESNSGASQYTDYFADPARQVTLVRGTTNNTITVSKSWAGTLYNSSVSVWVDFNRNGTFETTEQILNSPANTTTPVSNINFTVPATAYNGPFKTRMRVILREGVVPSPCGTFTTYGEVEDYAVTFIDAVPCSTAAPANLYANNLTSTTATLTWTPASPAATTTYVLEWRPVTTPASAWTTVPVTNSYYNLTGLTEQTQYEFRVRYVCNGVPGNFSNPFPFTTPPLPYCQSGSYVMPVDEHITNVTVTPSAPPFPLNAPMVSNSGPSNYTDYYLDPTRLVTLTKSSTGNSISVEKGWVNAASNVAVAAWIDFNRNGTFETAERIMNTPANQTTPVTGNFVVPAGAYTGPLPVRMRVVARLTTVPTACGVFNYGEVEDYAVLLEEPIPCNNAAPLNVVVSGITHNTATVTWTHDPGGATYIVQYKPVGAANWTGQIPVTYLTGTYTIPNLTPSTQYIVQVVALCDNVPGAPTEVPFETKCDPEPPTNFTVTSITPNSALVSWNPVPTASYVLQYREVGAATWTTVTVTGTSYSLTGLNPYTTYEVRVASECSGAVNPYTTPQVFTTLPTCEMAPIGLTVTNITMTQAQVDWNAYPGATYVLRWRKVGSSGWNTQNLTVNTYIITGLFEETQYEVQIANVCGGTTQQFTHPYVFTTPGLMYCDMTAASSAAEHISNVNVRPAGGTEMNSDSDASGYTSYVNDITRHILLVQGSTGNRISISKEWANTQYNEAVTVWIDFNRDGVFSNSERILIAPANQNTPVTGTFSVPADAYVSLTNDKYVVMRVAMSRDGSPEMCSTFANGEVEDYRVRITKAMPTNIMDPNQINVYPNPVKNTLFITKVKDGAKYNVYSAIGQLIQSGIVIGNKIDVSKLINGVFVIDITDTNGQAVQKKFIKE